MFRGVPLANGVRTERLVDWYYEEKHSEIARTMLLVAAITEQDNINDYVNKYIQSIIPSEKANEEFLALNQEILSKESMKEYKVKRIQLPGEDE